MALGQFGPGIEPPQHSAVSEAARFVVPCGKMSFGP